jgi:hypothetical protein
VEGPVVWVLELDVLESFVRLDEAVADNLDLWLVGDGLQVWVQDAALSVQSLSMAVAGGSWVEALSQLELCLWGDVLLVLEDNDLIAEQSIFDDLELLVCKDMVSSHCSLGNGTKHILTRRLPISRVLSLVVQGFSLIHARVGFYCIPLRFSRSMPEISAPKSTLEPSGTAIGLTVICGTVIVMVMWCGWKSLV